MRLIATPAGVPGSPAMPAPAADASRRLRPWGFLHTPKGLLLLVFLLSLIHI